MICCIYVLSSLFKNWNKKASSSIRTLFASVRNSLKNSETISFYFKDHLLVLDLITIAILSSSNRFIRDSFMAS